MSAASDLTNQIIDYLYRQKIYCWRQNNLGIWDAKKGIYRPGAKKGVSDILGCLPPSGKLIAIEVKWGKDKISPEQEGFLENIRHCGGITIIARTFEGFVSDWNQKISTFSPLLKG